MGRVYTRSASEPDSVRVVIQPVSPNYFAALGMPLLRGRDLTWDDPTTGEGVAVITPAIAEQFFGDADPIGQVISWGSGNPLPLRVVGVVPDPMYWSLATDEDVNIFVPYEIGAALSLLEIIVRTNADLAAVAPAMRQAVRDLDPQLPVPEIRLLREHVAESVAEERFLMALLGTFAAVAILLAAGGVYGTMLYAVSQRHHEFGIRMALGARSGQMVLRVLVQGMVLTGIGLILGVAGALALARVLENLVFGITTTDPLTFIAVVLLLGTIALLASTIPAVRAARTDPAVTLRS
jgi:predicted permease